MYEKTNNNKTHLLLRILAVIGRYGPHLMIVMIFVTQNNFVNGPGISDCLLGFYPKLTDCRNRFFDDYFCVLLMCCLNSAKYEEILEQIMWPMVAKDFFFFFKKFLLLLFLRESQEGDLGTHSALYQLPSRIRYVYRVDRRITR